MTRRSGAISALHALGESFMNATTLGFLSFLLTGGTIYLWYLRLRDVSVPKNRSGFAAAWLSGAALGIAAFSEGVGWIGGVPAAVGIFGGVFPVLLIAISPQKVADDAIAVGALLPDFTAIDEDGETFESSSLAGHPVLIKFFRGHW
jgi:hypothetical protein